MPPDCEDSDQTKTPERTPAFDNGFGPNTNKLGHILKFSEKATEKYTAELKTLSTGLVGLRGPGGEQVEKIRTITEELVRQVTDFVGGVLVIHEMMPVLSVAIVEAYLKDVLIYATGIDSSLINPSKTSNSSSEGNGQEALSIMAGQRHGSKSSNLWGRAAIVRKP